MVHGPEMVVKKDEMTDKKPKKFPKSVFFIIGNEFCERFSYYGMRTVLSVYLTSQLHMEQHSATVVYHAFVMLCYFTPVLGSMLADGFLGKFRTIFYVSLVYALGNIVLALATTPPLHFPMLPMSMVGLFLIGLGTGGIKPCVSAFGGDQFDTDQVKHRERFFFIFYFAINAGSLISTFLTPLLKGGVKCFDMDTCYPLAFGFPAGLLVIAVIIFVAGKPLYRILPANGNVVVRVSKCIAHALSRRIKSRGEKKNHWLDYANDEFDAKFISEVRAALRVMYLYLPLPLFWALFELQGSLWTFQAQELNGRLTDSYSIIPEQMQVVNPLLCLMLIPVFESGVYPLLAKCNIFTKPLPRMFVGGMFAALAFLVAGFLQLRIESGYPADPSDGHFDIVFINNGPCYLKLEAVNSASLPLNITLDHKMFTSRNLNVPIGNMTTFDVDVTPSMGQCDDIAKTSFQINVTNGNAVTVAFVVHNGKIQMHQAKELRQKPGEGDVNIRLIYNLVMPGHKIMFKKDDSDTKCVFNIENSDGAGLVPEYCSTSPGIYYLHLPNGTNGELVRTGRTIFPRNGGQYDINLFANGTADEQIVLNSHLEVPENDINMLNQIPQYVIITLGEIMFSITGLEFSYSQAPASMKSVLQAAWLLTTAFGNVIIIIISEARFFDVYSSEYFLYAGLMVLVMLLFAYMCLGYVYVKIDDDGNVVYPEDQDLKEHKSPLTNARVNGGFSVETENADI